MRTHLCAYGVTYQERHTHMTAYVLRPGYDWQANLTRKGGRNLTLPAADLHAAHKQVTRWWYMRTASMHGTCMIAWYPGHIPPLAGGCQICVAKAHARRLAEDAKREARRRKRMH